MNVATCPEEGVVLDPFMGSGTVAIFCRKSGDFIKFDIPQECVDLENYRLEHMI